MTEQEKLAKEAGFEVTGNAPILSTEGRILMSVITGVGAAAITRVVMDDYKELDGPQAIMAGTCGIAMGVATYMDSKDKVSFDDAKTIRKTVGTNLTLFTLAAVAGKALGKVMS